MTSRILVSLRVATMPEHAFEMFVCEIGVWWRANALFRFTPRASGVVAFETGLGGRFTETSPDGQVFEIGRITVWEPGIRLAFTWRQASFAPEQVTEVEVRFEPVGNQTRVTVEHRGWDTIPSSMWGGILSPTRYFCSGTVNGGRPSFGPTGRGSLIWRDHGHKLDGRTGTTNGYGKSSRTVWSNRAAASGSSPPRGRRPE